MSGDVPVLGVFVLMLAMLWLGWLWGQRKPEPEPVLAVPLPEPDKAAAVRDLISIEALTDPALIVAGPTAIAANAQARALFGERVVGGDMRLVVRHPVVLDGLAQAGRGVSVSRELNGLGSGNSAWRMHAAPDGEGQILVIFDDITQTRLTERMRVDFVANASHELRTPLATLSGFIETLQGPAADDGPARARFLAIMASEASRMSRLIDDLLSLSRIELDKYVRPSLSLDLKAVFADVGKTLAMRLEQDQRHLELDIADDLPLVIGDRDQILQVLHNLVSNALKYGQTGTPIVVKAVAVPGSGGQVGQVLISVADRGEGISAEHLPRLTERFYRVDSQRSRKLGGTGLGLAIVKHIVERHRGRLEIESVAGQGSVVSFTLPQASRPVEAAPAAMS